MGKLYRLSTMEDPLSELPPHVLNGVINAYAIKTERDILEAARQTQYDAQAVKFLENFQSFADQNPEVLTYHLQVPNETHTGTLIL
jgi:hypothetical protein